MTLRRVSTAPRVRATPRRERPRARRARVARASRATRVCDAETYAKEVATALLAQHRAAATMRGAVYDGALDVIVKVDDVRCAPVMRLYDRGFTRGHAVFDACTIHDGRCHLLREHLRRFARNARDAGVVATRDDPLATIEALVLDVVRQSEVKYGQVRVYATSGCDSENFSLCEPTDSAPTYYVAAYEKDPTAWTVVRGLTAASSPVPIKPPRYATLKSTNYLPNVHVARTARDDGVDVGVFSTRDGAVGEGPGANVAFLTPDGALRTPPATDVLDGITMRRLRALIESSRHRDALRNVGVARFDDSRPVSPRVVVDAVEAMLVGSAVGVQAIVSWDGHPIGDGRVGSATRALAQLLLDDMRA